MVHNIYTESLVFRKVEPEKKHIQVFETFWLRDRSVWQILHLLPWKGIIKLVVNISLSGAPPFSLLLLPRFGRIASFIACSKSEFVKKYSAILTEIFFSETMQRILSKSQNLGQLSLN